jgi:20S proteasome alpha/beta subunit
MKVYDETWLGAEFMAPSKRVYQFMTAIIAMVEDDQVTIKGDTLQLVTKSDGSGEIIDKYYGNKLYKITNHLVAGFSCLNLDPAYTNAIRAYCEAYTGPGKPSVIVRKLCTFLDTLLEKQNSGKVELVLAGCDKAGPVLYKIEYDRKASFKRTRSWYAAAGVGVVVDDIIAHLGSDTSVDDIFDKIVEAERSHIEAYGSIMFHVGGHITGWVVTPKGATELPASERELPTQVGKGDYMRSIVGRAHT